VGWLAAVVLSIFKPSIAPKDQSRIRPVCSGSRLLEHHASDRRLDSGDARPGLDLPLCTTARNHLEIRFARSKRSDDSLVGPHFDVWGLRPQDAVWTCLWHPRRGDRVDGLAAALCDDRLSWRGLERRKRSNSEFMTEGKRKPWCDARSPLVDLQADPSGLPTVLRHRSPTCRTCFSETSWSKWQGAIALRWRANRTIDYDVLRSGSFSVEPLVAIVVGRRVEPSREIPANNPREREYDRTSARMVTSVEAAALRPFRPGCSSHVAAELDLAGENRTSPLRIHYQQNKVCRLYRAALVTAHPANSHRP
jgi:hypothetical protein